MTVHFKFLLLKICIIKAKPCTLDLKSSRKKMVLILKIVEEALFNSSIIANTKKNSETSTLNYQQQTH